MAVKIRMSNELDKLCIMVTRPIAQADHLCRLIKQYGGSPFIFPVLEISDPPDTTRLFEIIHRLDDFDLAIFISANAVNQAIKYIKLCRRQIPAKLKLATIGEASACALQNLLGREPDVCPKTQFNSEALLAMGAMQEVADLSIVIFRGEGGRGYLGDTLRQRGAKVEYASVYRRSQPKANLDTLRKQLASGGVHVITITSGEGIHNLCNMLGEEQQHWLRNTQLVVVNQRLVALVQELGFIKPAIVAATASDDDIVEAIRHWHQGSVKDVTHS